MVVAEMQSGSLPSSQQTVAGLNLQPSMYMDNLIYIDEHIQAVSITVQRDAT